MRRIDCGPSHVVEVFSQQGSKLQACRRVGLSMIAITFGIVVGGATAMDSLSAQQTAISGQFHPPAERSNAASMESFEIPSHGASLNAFRYIAAGAGPHPVAVLLHGLPGNERNLDLAQDVRRAGWNVLYMDYRGSWGSQGDFSFSHSVEDVVAAITYLRNRRGLPC
jgi:dipeptidyl aminopeptidase/acylaminoacyl peptidase